MVTIELVPYSAIESLSSLGRIRKLLNIAKQNKIVLLQGRLTKMEETELIKTTMEEISKDFKGIELAVIDPGKSKASGLFSTFKMQLATVLLGDQTGLTIIGPASVVKSIKKDPNKIQLLLGKEKTKKKRR